MKFQSLYRCFSVVALAASFVASASAADLLSDLKASEEGAGTVTVNQSAQITTLMQKKKSESANKTQITFAGYRVQVYMGNQQRTSKDEAESRESRIKAKYPDVKTYVTFASPFWKLRCGNFRTHADALVLAHKLKAAFPNISDDIFVVRDAEVIDTDVEQNQ